MKFLQKKSRKFIEIMDRSLNSCEDYTKLHSGIDKKMTCKGICVRYKAQKPVGTGRYASGQRRCQICEIFIKWEGLWCPCCGYRLRTKPRNLKYKAKLRARVEADTKVEKKAEAIAIKA